jgi:hypothetical protein
VDGVTAVVLGELVAFRGTAPYNVTTLLGSGGGPALDKGACLALVEKLGAA